MSGVLNIEPPRAERIRTGMADDVREQLAKHLSVILADTYRLTVKSHLYHWNVARSRRSTTVSSRRRRSRRALRRWR